MKGDSKLIDALNGLLADELTAINQYMVHAEMCEDWGYGRLAGTIKKRAIVEMKHAEKLIERVLFLEGQPVVSVLNKITIGKNVQEMVKNDHKAEAEAIKAYNAAMAVAATAKDNATRKILQDILKDEDAHIDLLEEMQDQIEQMGIQNFLANQVDNG
ncbi:MAG: bacterioferritin [Deferribacteraceae bacterium]|jgi:bacterioferritin|nr:bacterioferritin [Deferribacteraceae bacterium]